MAPEQELSTFLLSVEKRTFKQAVFAVCDNDAAPDIAQDAMIELAEKYGDKPGAKLSLLFQCILQSTIHGWFRRTKVHNIWISLFSNFRSDAEGNGTDPFELIESEASTTAAEGSTDKVEHSQMLETLEHGVEKLPARQRRVPLICYWEGMDIAETAQVVGCSEGSVRTHYSRATHALAQALRVREIRL